MSINKRQFTLLQAMGITVWQRRELSNHSSPLAVTDNKVVEAPNKLMSALMKIRHTNVIAEHQPNHLYIAIIVIDLTAYLSNRYLKTS